MAMVSLKHKVPVRATVLLKPRSSMRVISNCNPRFSASHVSFEPQCMDASHGKIETHEKYASHFLPEPQKINASHVCIEPYWNYASQTPSEPQRETASQILIETHI